MKNGMMSKKKMSLSRREFLGTTGCAAMGYSTLLSGIVNLKCLGAAVATNTSVTDDSLGYKALVCLCLDGGNDSFNMLVPYGKDEYQNYQNARANLALPRTSIKPLDTTTKDGMALGLHPSMPRLQTLFNHGKAAFVSNVGTLVEPITSADLFYSGNLRRPYGMYSHIDQLAQWHTGMPNDRSLVGWGGRLADLMMDMNADKTVSMNISLNGNNTFQTGREVFPFSISSHGGGIQIDGYNGTSAIDRIRRTAINDLISHNYHDIFKNTYVETVNTAQNMNSAFGLAIQEAPSLSTQFVQNELSPDFEMVARTISIRKDLNVSRQIFFINYRGWDHHDELTNNQARMLSVVDDALADFYAALEELGVADNVILYTISDFGRNLTSNGNGTDHAWGGNSLLLGGSLNGGAIFGNYPELYLGHHLDLGGGVFIPTTSTDEYFAELALWFGVFPSDLEIVLPNIRNFYSPESGLMPVGFLTK